MKTYTITIAETYILEFTVLARSEEEANSQVEERYAHNPEQVKKSFSYWENLGTI